MSDEVEGKSIASYEQWKRLKEARAMIDPTKPRQDRCRRRAQDAIEAAFEALGGTRSLVEWAAENQTEFYKLWSRLLPRNVQVDGGDSVTLGMILAQVVVAQRQAAESLPLDVPQRVEFVERKDHHIPNP